MPAGSFKPVFVINETHPDLRTAQETSALTGLSVPTSPPLPRQLSSSTAQQHSSKYLLNISRYIVLKICSNPVHLETQGIKNPCQLPRHSPEVSDHLG